MILPTEDYSFKLLTACFCGGADQFAPAEVRVPSIRGQVRAWHRVVTGAEVVSRVWGSTSSEAGSSRVALIWDASVAPRQANPKPYILPHKNQGSRPALAADQSFTLKLQRLIGCSSNDWAAAQKAMKLWLLVGCLGLRSNRAAGSVWPVGDWVPQTPAQLGETLRDLRFTWPVKLIETPDGTKADALRRMASDTIRNRNLFGDSDPRKPSPTKFKVIELNGQSRLLVTAPPAVNLAEARAALSGPNKAGRFEWKQI